MNTTSETNSEKFGVFPYVLGGMSFIPIIGVLFGITAIVWGLGTKKLGGKSLAAIGAGGIAFTCIVYGALFYFGVQQRGGVYDDLRAKMAQSSINSLVPAVEFYKVQNGKYPESLEALQKSQPKDGFFVSVFDPSVAGFSTQPRYFFYERVGDDHYYLRGLGADGKPFTVDDIVPKIPSEAGSKLGLLLQRKADS